MRPDMSSAVLDRRVGSIENQLRGIAAAQIGHLGHMGRNALLRRIALASVQNSPALQCHRNAISPPRCPITIEAIRRIVHTMKRDDRYGSMRSASFRVRGLDIP